METTTKPIFRCPMCNTEYSESSAQEECTETCVKFQPLRTSIITDYCSRQNAAIDTVSKVIKSICQKEGIESDILVFSKHTYGIAVTIVSVPKNGLILWDHIINLLLLYFIPVNKSSFIINLSLAEIFAQRLESYFGDNQADSQEDNAQGDT